MQFFNVFLCFFNFAILIKLCKLDTTKKILLNLFFLLMVYIKVLCQAFLYAVYMDDHSFKLNTLMLMFSKKFML